MAALLLLVWLAYFSGVVWLMVWRERRNLRRLQQVQAVRRRLASVRLPVYLAVVQANDGQRIRFTSTLPLRAGDYVEVHGDMLYPADLLSSNRIVGVVVSCVRQ